MDTFSAPTVCLLGLSANLLLFLFTNLPFVMGLMSFLSVLFFSLSQTPCGRLDPVVSTRMEDLVRELQRVCRTCVVVTHSFSTVRRTVDRVVFLHEGKVRWDGPVSDIDRTDNPYVRQFFSASLNGPMEFQDGIRQSRIGDAGPRQSDSDGLEEDLSRK